ncbi:diacylglycerol kinase family protein [Oceanibacterium hippocampi]|nr:diacylglycerol kinase family protein [Oceanibacterium hippocampi]
MTDRSRRGHFALISNPLSQRNRRGMEAIEAVLDDLPGIDHYKLGDVAEMPDILRHLAADGTRVVALNGGDGTVQAGLTHILEDRPFESPPAIAILPRGMTNMTAADVGLTGRPGSALRKLHRGLAGDGPEPAIRNRHVLRLENAAGFPPQRGMFFGAAAIVQAIELCRDRVHSLGLEAALANGVTLLGLLANWLFRGAEGSVLRGENVSIRIDGEVRPEAERLLVLATTLDRLVLGSRPFWNDDREPLRFTAIDYPPDHLFRRAGKLLYGGPERALPAGYRSCGAGRVELDMTCRFTLDGQLYDPEPGKPVILSAADRLDFLRI